MGTGEGKYGIYCKWQYGNCRKKSFFPPQSNQKAFFRYWLLQLFIRKYKKSGHQQWYEHGLRFHLHSFSYSGTDYSILEYWPNQLTIVHHPLVRKSHLCQTEPPQILPKIFPARTLSWVEATSKHGWKRHERRDTRPVRLGAGGGGTPRRSAHPLRRAAYWQPGHGARRRAGHVPASLPGGP